MTPTALTSAQKAALGAVRSRASSQVQGAHLWPWPEASHPPLQVIALHFHPDRIGSSKETVAEGLLKDGIYRSQFETGISNGSPTAYPGGLRDEWERTLFSGAYHAPGVLPSERPIYGALDLLPTGDGPAPRFGSCYILLRPEVSRRATFTWGDSHLGPEAVGTLDAFHGILEAWAAAIEETGGALGHKPLTLLEAADAVHSRRDLNGDGAVLPMGRRLDDYVEAQVHGPIDLARDGAALIADPSFKSTATGEVLGAICRRYDLQMGWHRGFQLRVDAIPSGFRGPRMAPLARRILEGETPLNAHTLGLAAQRLHLHPETWADWGPIDECLQHIKQLWHVLVAFGAPQP